jgi:hypothetical protein
MMPDDAETDCTPDLAARPGEGGGALRLSRRRDLATSYANGRRNGRFSFTLDVTHPRLGQLIWQRALFREIES